jgi:catechol 2,3-dioxygenase-like lactoylglutathione lyase family enzyme
MKNPEFRIRPAINHIALACNDLEQQTKFYRSLGFVELSRHHDDRGLRSVWLDCHPAILMLERADQCRREKTRSYHEKEAGLHLLAFTIDAAAADDWRALLEERKAFVGESSYTLYACDSEGNRIAFSSYPERLRPRPYSRLRL